ncbi:MAG: cobyrinate a,c-diamide synthase [Nitrososphaera sp.]|uniref:cobyrinate a,c-diamide synthase n=1 Tax=Nitrososphaera sp. TaxID=1971748 RepID=UPI003D6E535E
MQGIPRVVVAGVTSGVGKTTVAVAVMHALRKRGFRVQPFKVGPDFIDPSYHTLVTGRQSRNLDAWLMKKGGVLESFSNAVQGADIAVIEGVMGLYDGMSGRDNYASTAHVARMLDAPVVLVVDAGKATRSIAAVVLGFTRFDRSTRIAGVVLNNVAGDRHAGYLQDALAKIKVPIVGMVKRNKEIRMEERHLGLVPAQELHKSKRAAIVKAARYVADQLDVDAVVALCGRSPLPRTVHTEKEKEKVRIAVALDESFNFYYSDNLDALRRHGARLVFFSPVHDRRLPDAEGAILGGGFPEVLADQLEGNGQMIKSVAKAVGEGMPVYGECGGLMYLTRSISGYKGEKKRRKMVGVVDADTAMTARLTLNYTEAHCDGPIFGRASLHGHEFHYSAMQDIAPDSRFAYTMKKGNGVAGGRDGFIVGNSLAAYMHLHFSNDRLPRTLVKSCASHSRR